MTNAAAAISSGAAWYCPKGVPGPNAAISSNICAAEGSRLLLPRHRMLSNPRYSHLLVFISM